MPDAAKVKQMLHMIWCGMAASVVAYWLAFHFILAERGVGAALPALIPILAIMAGTEVIGAFVWFRLSISKMAPQVTAGGLERMTPEQRSALMARLQSMTVICLVLLESAGVFGLVIGLVGAPQYVVCFIGSSLIALTFFRTREMGELYALIDRLASVRPGSA